VRESERKMQGMKKLREGKEYWAKDNMKGD
jgi:hypothetical protein